MAEIVIGKKISRGMIDSFDNIMQNIDNIVNKELGYLSEPIGELKCTVSITGFHDNTKKLLAEMANAKEGDSSVSIKTEYGELNIEINLPF